MGLLSSGTPSSWNEVNKYVDHVRYHGILQSMNTIKKYEDRQNDKMLWGDETEYMVVKSADGKAILSSRQEEILGASMSASRPNMAKESDNVSFHQEYGRFMVEATPGQPYGDSLNSLLDVEANMNERRVIAQTYLDPGEHLFSIASYPRLGVGHFAETDDTVNGEATRSLFLPDKVINSHPRFPTSSSNIRQRRGKKVEIAVPVYKDINTHFPWKDPIASQEEMPEHFPENNIYMDAMGFGMGCCCLQLTMQGANMDQARDSYDGLAPLTPILLALSAASPVFRGISADQDIRWNVVSASVDDRTDGEKLRIPKSRYASIDCYISRTNPISTDNPKYYNDIDVPTNEKICNQLNESGSANDPLLVQHFAHLFIRDPLVIFKELIDQNDNESTDHFENIQSTNWQTMRFKPPPNKEIGWRTEFRPMDIQFTDFENAAYTVFLILLARTLSRSNSCFYQPLSQVDANMDAAHVRDPIRRGKFWFRTNVKNQSPSSDPDFKLLSLDQIINGSPEFTGCIPLVREYLSQNAGEMSAQTTRRLNQYLQLISMRASGKLKTNAQWIRDFISNHPDYKHDSIVSEKVNFDLLSAIKNIEIGKEWDELHMLQGQ